MAKNGRTEQRLLLGEGTVKQQEIAMKYINLIFEALFSRPIIGHRGWEDEITEEQRQRIKIERLKQVAEA